MKNKVSISWHAQPDEKNYPAALSYLTVLFEEGAAARYVARLRRAGMAQFKAKDIFRASGLSLLGVSNRHVERNREKIKLKTKLSPILLVRSKKSERVIVADGYHRVCAVYFYDEDAIIPCKIVREGADLYGGVNVS